jgi:hypothetical protein
MITKQFDQKLYDESDKRCKDLTKAFFRQHKLEAKDNPDKYGVDLLVYDEKEYLFSVEVEWKGSWKGAKFPFKDIQLTYRKKKLVYIDKLYFFTFNYGFDHFMIIPKEKLLIYGEIKEIPNKLVASGEFFYSLPVSFCIIKKVRKE